MRFFTLLLFMASMPVTAQSLRVHNPFAHLDGQKQAGCLQTDYIEIETVVEVKPTGLVSGGVLHKEDLPIVLLKLKPPFQRQHIRGHLFHSSLSPQVISFNQRDVLKFNAVTPGAFRLDLLIQETSHCQLARLEFSLTANPSREISHFDTGEVPSISALDFLKAKESWRYTRGGGMLVAFIDSGINYLHPDLSSRLWRNEKEIPYNQIDDDDNGLIDDIYGWDYVNNDSLPFDDNGHGTHVAGLAAGLRTGLAPGLRLLPLKVIDPLGYANFDDIQAAIRYALRAGARVINLSIGGNNAGEAEYRRFYTPLLAEVRNHDAILIVASGNGGGDGVADNNDVSFDSVSITEAPNYPAAFIHENLISVASTDLTGKLTDYSNYGQQSVLVAAPGGTLQNQLWSTSHLCGHENFPCYRQNSGTSMAVPFVSALVAQMLALNPQLSAAQIKQLLSRYQHPQGSSDLSLKIFAGIISPVETLKQLSAPLNP